MLIPILQLLHCKWAIPIYIFCYNKCEDGTLVDLIYIIILQTTSMYRSAAMCRKRIN